MAIKSQSERMPNCWCTARFMRASPRCNLLLPPSRRWRQQRPEALLDQAFGFHCFDDFGALRNSGFVVGENRPLAQVNLDVPGPVQHGEQIRIRDREGVAEQKWLRAEEARQPVEFLGKSSPEGFLHLRRACRIEQRRERLVDFGSDVVQYFHQLVALEGSPPRRPL